MIFAYYIVLVLSHYPWAYAENTILATGGGVVEKGKDLILTYKVDEKQNDWFLCTWTRYEPASGNEGETTRESCNFLDSTSSSNGTVVKQKCRPADLMETNQMEYTGTTKNECKIKVNNVSKDDSVMWAAQIDADIESKKIDITVATPLDSVVQTVDPEAIDVGTKANISCTVMGGDLIPEITYLYGAVDSNTNLTVTNRTQQTEKLDNGTFKTIALNTIIPQIQDHGRTIDCVAIQYDKSEPKQILFRDVQGTNGSFNANTLTLNVLFPPQPNTNNQTFHYVKGNDAKISISIMANPKPISIKWIIQDPNNTSTNETETTPSSSETVTTVDIEIPSTENRERYTLYNLTDQQVSTQYLANLTILNITNADHLKMYSLQVTNLKGLENYYFDINITDFVPTTVPPPTTTTPVVNTTQQTTPEGKGSSGVVTALVVIVVIAILTIGGVILYKKYYMNRQTVPHYNLR